MIQDFSGEVRRCDFNDSMIVPNVNTLLYDMSNYVYNFPSHMDFQCVTDVMSDHKTSSYIRKYVPILRIYLKAQQTKLD